ALGLIDRAPTRPDELVERIRTAPALGHPLGSMELVAPQTQLTDVLDALKDRGLIVEGEVEQELTPDGESRRATVRFSPKEGVLSKVLNRVTVSVDLTTKFFG